ncbi:phage tail protein [Streptococcus suis]|nr:phage tail protein [Streptococcus suis]NQN06681.1 phage tail protein [Streptococcus suis]NQN08876.1 phage tail protein [Streptococcus suis]NQN14899.1 phage tail protein [Streptococcus suis]NQO56613.1 phage tail protein [Streptococcus suis]
MATDLGSAYVQIVPSAKGISGSISKLLGGEVDSAGRSAGSSLGASLVSALSGALAAAGIGKIIGSALSAGADLQQSFGGLDTIYDGAQESAKRFAQEAYKAGVSANTYAEQAVSMGASLKQSLGGDSTKAINMANKAIMDMTDNAAKMGTDIGVIQQTYQSLSRGNYAMLDNLKLGFGGTKSEMERLLKTAEGLPSAMGRKFDISNYADVVEAIHLVQESMGIAGVAAAEAQNTYSGSLAAMKASWENTLAGLSLGENIAPQLQALATTTSNFLFGNFFPMVGNIFKGLPSAIGTFIAEAMPLILEQGKALLSGLVIGVETGLPEFEMLVTGLTANFRQWFIEEFPTLMQTGVELLSNLGQGIISAIPDLLTTFSYIFLDLVVAFANFLPTMLQAGSDLLLNLIDGIILNIPNLLLSAQEIFRSFTEVIQGSLPQMLEKGSEILVNLVQGIVERLPEIGSAAIELVGMFIDFLTQNLPDILRMGVEFVVNIVNGLVQELPQLTSTALELAGEFLSMLLSKLPDILSAGVEILTTLISGILSILGNVGQAALDIGAELLGGVEDIDLFDAGAAILSGFVDGLRSMWGEVTSFVGGIADWIAENKGPISYDRVLLKPAGLAIMDGLNTNLKVGFKDVMGTVSGMAGAIAKPFENQSLAYDMTSSASVDVRRNLLSSIGDLAGSESGTSLVARLANIERFLAALVDKELAVYLDGEKMAQNSYMHQGAIMAREGI